MGYESSVQVIERANRTRQFYLICPAPLAEALELKKGEVIEWVIEDKHTLTIQRSGRGADAGAVRGKRRG
jgi:bifunctional DNA-binding transcriptional regulator/antitoxin component of YhaV-PrlF toxin-antitoxin module